MARLATSEEQREVIRIVLAQEEHARRIARMTDEEFAEYQQRQIGQIEKQLEL